jgi:hypothetical protein
MAQYESYRTRAVPVRIPPRTDPNEAAWVRMMALRQLMRMEMPDRVTDVIDGVAPLVSPSGAVYTMPVPSLWRAYRRRAQNTVGAGWATDWSTAHQGAECLYMLLAMHREGDATGLDSFQESQFDDTDNDGMPEILDAWGRPIEFLRWAPGCRAYPGPDGQWGAATVDDDGNGIVDDSAEAAWTGTDDVPSPSDLQTGNAYTHANPFDPLKQDYRLSSLDTSPFNDPFALFPLIFSAGRDRQYDIVTDVIGGSPFRYITTTETLSGTAYPNDPYFILDAGNLADPNDDIQMGKPVDASSPPDGLNHADNLTNHSIALGSR